MHVLYFTLSRSLSAAHESVFVKSAILTDLKLGKEVSVWTIIFTSRSRHVPVTVPSGPQPPVASNRAQRTAPALRSARGLGLARAARSCETDSPCTHRAALSCARARPPPLAPPAVWLLAHTQAVLRLPTHTHAALLIPRHAPPPCLSAACSRCGLTLTRGRIFACPVRSPSPSGTYATCTHARTHARAALLIPRHAPLPLLRLCGLLD
ncbi:hypothetical protein EI94DRAFT_1836636, partial [Lactarius quietus]